MTLTTPSSLEIAQAATLRPISDVAADLGVAEEHLEHYGTGADALEGPVAALQQRLTAVLDSPQDLSPSERSARVELANRQVTLR